VNPSSELVANATVRFGQPGLILLMDIVPSKELNNLGTQYCMNTHIVFLSISSELTIKPKYT